jgi:hypothetical protein
VKNKGQPLARRLARMTPTPDEAPVVIVRLMLPL